MMRYSLTLRRVAPYLDGDVLRQLAALERAGHDNPYAAVLVEGGER